MTDAPRRALGPMPGSAVAGVACRALWLVVGLAIAGAAQAATLRIALLQRDDDERLAPRGGVPAASVPHAAERAHGGRCARADTRRAPLDARAAVARTAR